MNDDAMIAAPGVPGPSRAAEAASAAALERVADGLFAAFVYVADAGAGLAAADVEQWHAWVRRPRPQAPQAWPLLAEVLATRFAGLWKRHVAAGQRPLLRSVVQDLRGWQALVADDHATWLHDELASLL